MCASRQASPQISGTRIIALKQEEREMNPFEKEDNRRPTERRACGPAHICRSHQERKELSENPCFSLAPAQESYVFDCYEVCISFLCFNTSRPSGSADS